MGFAWWSIIAVVSALVIVGILVWVIRWTPTDGAARDGALAARVVLGLALIGAALSALSAIAAVLQAALADEVAVTVPVGGFLPPVDEAVFDLAGPTAEALPSSPGFTEAALTVVGLDGWARAWLALGHAVNGAVIVTLLLLVAGLARRALRAEPFVQPLSARLALGGAALAVGSIIWQAALGFGGSLASAQVFGAESWASAGQPGDRYLDAGLGETGLPLPNFAFEVEFWPVGVGLALIVLAGLLRTAERLQRETAGLV